MRPLGRQRRRREDNIKIYLKEIGYEVVGRTQLAEDRAQCRVSLNKVTKEDGCLLGC
jgi:hypothetical protein